MENPFTGRTSRTTAGWIFAAIFFGWVGFVILVDPRPKPEPPPWTPPPPKPKLAAYGLPENPDWERLPEFFRLWQDDADWIRDRTTFGYWSPGSADYGYVFEAVRKNGALTFRLIAPPFDYNPTLGPGEATPAEHPLRFIHSPEVGRAADLVEMSPVPPPAAPAPVLNRTKATIEVSPVPVTIPVEPTIPPLPSSNAGERKK